MFNPEDLLKSLVKAKKYSKNSHEKVKTTYYKNISNVEFHTTNAQQQFTNYFNKVYKNMFSDHSSIFGGGKKGE